MKKQVFSVATALVLTFNQANALGGIPTTDLINLNQAILEYTQQINQYKQMLVDTANFKSQMNELGVGMNDINDILRNLTSMISDMEKVQSGVTDIPQDFLGNVEQVQNACSFLQSKSPYYKNKISSVSNFIQDDFYRCTSTLKNDTEIKQNIDELLNQIDSSTTSKEEKDRIYTEIQNIKNAQIFIKQKANEELSNRLIAFYDTYHKKDQNNPYTKLKMDNDLKQLTKALNTPNNQKQAQALTNSILIKILEMMQKQYELNMEYSNALVNLNQNTQNYKSLSQKDFDGTNDQVNVDNSKYLIYKNAPKYQTDESGFPTFTINSPAKKQNSILGN